MNGKLVRVWPDDYPAAHQCDPGDPTVKLLGSSNIRSLRIATDREKGILVIFAVPFGFEEYFIGLGDGFHIYRPPKKATSPGSEAIYWARSKDKKRGLLLQLLRPHSSTSQHYHRAKTESFHLIAGRAELVADKKVLPLEDGNTQTIQPGVIHQVRTESRPALTMMEIIGDPEGLSMKDHHYVP